MNTSQLQLWTKIQNFEIDDPSSSFTFTDRLSRENAWGLAYSIRAIMEYKKFIFLIAISDQSLTPSDQVDQVWHLHLLYTQSYWIEFCKDLLQMEIHHGPTKGKEEKTLFKDQYRATLELYQSMFEVSPPKDLWPDPDTRMKEINFTRVNRKRNWVIPKLIFRNQ
ncbi:MAG: hypothetical protein P1U56_17250 [Saprospiraceae bacterium]|nr:hypothetical protein [Saprospiraceae bacterium]